LINIAGADADVDEVRIDVDRDRRIAEERTMFAPTPHTGLAGASGATA
jgi:hypothetical protein